MTVSLDEGIQMRWGSNSLYSELINSLGNIVTNCKIRSSYSSNVNNLFSKCIIFSDTSCFRLLKYFVFFSQNWRESLTSYIYSCHSCGNVGSIVSRRHCGLSLCCLDQSLRCAAAASAQPLILEPCSCSAKWDICNWRF